MSYHTDHMSAVEHIIVASEFMGEGKFDAATAHTTMATALMTAQAASRYGLGRSVADLWARDDVHPRTLLELAPSDPQTPVELFRAAWLELHGRTSPLVDLQRRSLEASTEGIPELEAELSELRRRFV